MKSSNANEGDDAGWAVALHGDTAVVGATFEDRQALGVDGDQHDALANPSGAASVYTTPPGSGGAFEYGSAASSANTLHLYGASTPVVADSAVWTTTQVASLAAFQVLAPNSAWVPLLGGVGRVEASGVVGLALGPASAGIAVRKLELPADPELAGLTLCFQAGAPDAALLGGVSLSNGLSVTFCS